MNPYNGLFIERSWACGQLMLTLDIGIVGETWERWRD